MQRFSTLNWGKEWEIVFLIITVNALIGISMLAWHCFINNNWVYTPPEVCGIWSARNYDPKSKMASPTQEKPATILEVTQPPPRTHPLEHFEKQLQPPMPNHGMPYGKKRGGRRDFNFQIEFHNSIWAFQHQTEFRHPCGPFSPYVSTCDLFFPRPNFQNSSGVDHGWHVREFPGVVFTTSNVEDHTNMVVHVELNP